MVYTSSVQQLDSIVRNFKAEKVEYNPDWSVKKKDMVAIYEPDKVVAKLSALPEYVSDAMLKRVTAPNAQSNYDKIVLDKWGKKDVETKKYVETPEIVFYRAALLAADGLKKNDPSLNYEQTVEKLFTKMSNKELFPNTPYMANGGHRIIAEQLKTKIESNNELAPEFKQKLLNDLEQEKKISQQLFACFVLDLYDSRQSIFQTLTDAAEIQAKIGGTGFNFSYLRPANETIHGTGGTTDGPVAFMSMFSNVLGKTMNQGGKREGANMFELDYNHADIMRFIYCKREDGEVSAANISVTTWHEFMKAATAEGEGRFFKLKNSHYNPKFRPHIKEYYTADQLKQSLEVGKLNSKAKINLLLAENGKDVLTPIMPEGLDEEYRTIGKIGDDGHVYLDGKKILRHIAFGAWFNGEPGMINLGHINDANPTHPKHYQAFLTEGSQKAKEILGKIGINPELPKEKLEEQIQEYTWAVNEEGRLINLPVGVGVMISTNPCGEKPLLGNESCVLGHTNLESILDKDSTTKSGYKINYERFRENITTMYEILDNAIDQNDFTNPRIEQTQKSNRKIGIGFMGLANMLYKLEVSYDSEEGRKLVDDLLVFWEDVSNEASHIKGEKFGTFPNFEYSMLRHGRPKRNAIVRTLAPTGTTGFAAQTTGGMEPEYALAFERTTVQGTKIALFNPVLEEKLEKYPIFVNKEDDKQLFDYVKNVGNGSLADFKITKGLNESDESFKKRSENLTTLKKIFVTTYDINAESHIRMEGIVQNHTDDAISKTTNFRNNAKLEDIEDAFILAYSLGIKGVTFYRDGTRKDQPLKTKGTAQKTETPAQTLEQKVDHTIPVGTADNPTKIPEITPAIKITQATPEGKLHTIVTYDPTNGRPLESFATLGNAGTQKAADVEGMGRLSSYILRLGGKLTTVIDQLINMGSGETVLKTRSGDLTTVPQSFGVALKKYQIVQEHFDLRKLTSGEYDLNELSAEVSDIIRDGNGKHPKTQEASHTETPKKTEVKTGECPKCGGKVVKRGGCKECENYGGLCDYTVC